MSTTAMTTTVMARTTADLVTLAREGDCEAYAELVRRHEPQLWAVVRGFRLSHADGHDAVQMTWLRLVENIDRLREPDRLGGWLVTTCRRECLRLLTGRGREVSGDDDRLVEQADARVPSPEKQVIDTMMAAELWRQVACLPARAQALLRALARQDAPRYADISRQLGMPIGSIGPSRGRYLRQLRAQLQQNGLDHCSWR
jgi:RNA polymerase sigma factor (sigma-70 family)